LDVERKQWIAGSGLNWRSLFPPWGSGPPFPKMAPPFTGFAHPPLRGSGTLPLRGSGGSMPGAFLGLSLLFGLAPTSTISSSSFGTDTIIVRACFPAFFREITFLYFTAVFGSSRKTWSKSRGSW
jgi:hypothetical protein